MCGPSAKAWDRRSGRPRHTVEFDLATLNIGLATAYRRVQNRQAWSTLVGTAAPSPDKPHDDDDDNDACTCCMPGCILFRVILRATDNFHVVARECIG